MIFRKEWRQTPKLPILLARKTLIVAGLLFLGITSCLILIRGAVVSQAVAQGLAASFTWSGQGQGTLNTQVSNQSYTGPKPARVEYGIYWCKKLGTAPCAPDFSGDQKASETLTFQTIDLAIPAQGQTQSMSLPNIASLASKTCGRFQVDLGFPSGGGIIGGQVFSIGPDCPPEPSPQPSQQPVMCPYSSTQAQVQKNSSDPWGDSKTITLGQSINLGGFHNQTGRFAGDPANPYSPNVANVDFVITEPGGTASQTLVPPYPIVYTPTKLGTYTFVGKTLKDVNNKGAGYFSESGCIDSGSITVVAVVVTPSPSPTPVATPRASPSPSPGVSPTPSPTPGVGGPPTSPSPSPSVSPSPVAGNTQPECVSLSASPTFGGAQLTVSFTGKGRDLDGIVRQIEFNFGDGESQESDVNGETNKDTLAFVFHLYKNPGIYQASLRVKDNSGQSNEWSTTPESCKVKIEVQGQVLGQTTTTPVSTLPKAGVGEALTITYILSGTLGWGLKRAAKKLKSL